MNINVKNHHRKSCALNDGTLKFKRYFGINIRDSLIGESDKALHYCDGDDSCFIRSYSVDEYSGDCAYEFMLRTVYYDYDIDMSRFENEIEVIGARQFTTYYGGFMRRNETYTIAIPKLNGLLDAEYYIEINDFSMYEIYDMLYREKCGEQVVIINKMIGEELLSEEEEESVTFYGLCVALMNNPRSWEYSQRLTCENFGLIYTRIPNTDRLEESMLNHFNYDSIAQYCIIAEYDSNYVKRRFNIKEVASTPYEKLKSRIIHEIKSVKLLGDISVDDNEYEFLMKHLKIACRLIEKGENIVTDPLLSVALVQQGLKHCILGTVPDSIKSRVAEIFYSTLNEYGKQTISGNIIDETILFHAYGGEKK